MLFLQSPHYEVLYGGAAGSGKTDALLVDACGLNQPVRPAITYPNYFAVMIRPTLPELTEVIRRTKTLYKLIDPGAEWRAGEHTWYFSSGARITFTFLKEIRDVDRFKSQEIQYIGWEELTLHPSSYGYKYLHTRVRKNESLKDINLYIRATTNPDGPGHAWVKEHWRIPDDGASTKFDVSFQITDKITSEPRTVTTTRQFISATLKDNPHIDPDYEAKIRLSGAQNTAALLEGRWDIVKIEGAYYHTECLEVINDGRIRDLPIDRSKPVHTAWDLGVSDYTSVWLMQQDGPWFDMVGFYQNHGESLSHYVQWLSRQGFILGTFYLPHDANNKRMGAERVETNVDMFRRMGIYDIKVVKRITHISTGINMTRNFLSRCRFDRERTREGWACLTNYRTEINHRTASFNPRPRHDQYSHGADAFRMFAQADIGGKSIATKYPGQRPLPKNMRAKRVDGLRNNRAP